MSHTDSSSPTAHNSVNLPAPSSDWLQRALVASRGTRTGAILACAAGVEHPAPHFVGKASVTSDGFLMCDFVDREDGYHHGAFVGSASDLDSNIDGLARFLRFSREDSVALRALIARWTATDYRSLST